MLSIGEVGCYVCGSQESDPWGEENGFTAVRCPDCQVVYLCPWPDLTDREEAIKYGLHSGESVINTNARHGGKALVGSYGRVLDEIYGKEGLGQRPVRWLDVGCGYGEFLEALSQFLPDGSRLKGSEPSIKKVKSAQERGLDVDSFRPEESSESWDRISLLNVYSHLPNPVEFLASLRDKLEEKGELLLQTGNGGEVTRDQCPDRLNFPDHLTFTSERGLRQVLGQLGFDIIGVLRRVSPEPTPLNYAKDVVKRFVRPNYNPVQWSGPYRSLWVRARR